MHLPRIETIHCGWNADGGKRRDVQASPSLVSVTYTNSWQKLLDIHSSWLTLILRKIKLFNVLLFFFYVLLFFFFLWFCCWDTSVSYVRFFYYYFPIYSITDWMLDSHSSWLVLTFISIFFYWFVFMCASLLLGYERKCILYIYLYYFLTLVKSLNTLSPWLIFTLREIKLFYSILSRLFLCFCFCFLWFSGFYSIGIRAYARLLSR